jgi:transposase
MGGLVAIGVDTHRDVHVAVALDRFGGGLGSLEISADAAGYARLWEWAAELEGAALFAVEGTGSYGAGLAAFLVAAGAEVFECERPRRRDRGRGKSDLIDASQAALRLLAGEPLARPRGGGVRDDLRLLLVQRQGAVTARTTALNQLHGITVTLPESLRSRLRDLRGRRLAEAALRLRGRQGESEDMLAVLHGIGRRTLQLSSEIEDVDRRLEQITSELVPDLLAECGVGPVTAAQLVVSSGDPRRMRSEASFAALAGTSPVEASSGLTKRHRLNRGGDRQLNRALHVIALSRIRHHQPTAAYYTRLRNNGKTPREARRCVKRQLARYFHQRLKQNTQLTLTP